ncbi:hypothetical protein [Hyalangium rubrum]|uniref:HEAT repeat domain-containing protein n=1 Tax=Hyalangium rubrum TaxID=3103134 RepID=A0ABU5H156_9BACT|nr:hypothetical protein [Hyalangium sp. s54d21]MDY7226468.1 hypothetical protein [Hyalangium sp. s54d21]
MAQLQDELITVFHQGDEGRARALVSRLGAEPRQARAVLEAMLENPEARVRQAAAFGLGELGGSASARRLEQQLALEETRGDYDGESVAEVITQALSRIKETGARATLVRRLKRLVTGSPQPSEVTLLARALWRNRHPELLPAVQQSMEQLSLPAPSSLHGLRVLLEKPPEALGAWAREPAIPVEYKTRVLTVLEEDVPEHWASTLTAFIATARMLLPQAVSQEGEAADYCERLFSLLLLHRERLLGALPAEARTELHAVARALVAATSMGCAVRAAVMLKLVGREEDAALLEAHRPGDATFAKVFDDAAHALRGPRRS